MSINPKFSRQVRNGKVVYVTATPRPQPDRARPQSMPKRLLGPFQASLNLLLLTGTVTTVMGLGWLSFQVITDPDVAFWLNQFLPTSKTTQTATHQPQTLQQILKRLQQQEQSPGKPIVLAAESAAQNPLVATKDILVPIYDKDCAEMACQQLQSLQVYRSLKLPALLRLFQGKRYYRLLDQVAIKGLRESKLVNLANNPRLVTGSTRPLPLSRIEAYHPAPKPGSWLRLTGLRTEGSATATYGQVMYFHPDEARLVLMLNWASPAGEYPRWQQVTGDQQPELMVSQTVGLEPRLAVYRIHPAPTGVLQMERISLAKPAFADQGYAQSLLLARSGLWSPAQKGLLAVKQKSPQRWSPKAQAQLDYINLHAKVAQSQAKQISANPVQSIVARLINGEWRAALKIFQTPNTEPSEVRELLLADPGRLATRVDAFLAVYPKDINAIAWGTLIRHLQDDPKTALGWAQQRTGKNKAALQRIKALVKRLDQPRYTPKEPLPKIPRLPSPERDSKKQSVQSKPPSPEGNSKKQSVQSKPPSSGRTSEKQLVQPKKQQIAPGQSSSPPTANQESTIPQVETTPQVEISPVPSSTPTPENQTSPEL